MEVNFSLYKLWFVEGPWSGPPPSSTRQHSNSFIRYYDDWVVQKKFTLEHTRGGSRISPQEGQGAKIQFCQNFKNPHDTKNILDSGRVVR